MSCPGKDLGTPGWGWVLGDLRGVLEGIFFSLLLFFFFSLLLFFVSLSLPTENLHPQHHQQEDQRGVSGLGIVSKKGRGGFASAGGVKKE